MSGGILNTILQSGLKGRFSPELISQLTSSAFALSDLDLSEEDKELISTVYMRGLHGVFISYAIFMALQFLLSLFIKEHSLCGKYDKPQVETSESAEEAEDQRSGH